MEYFFHIAKTKFIKKDSNKYEPLKKVQDLIVFMQLNYLLFCNIYNPNLDLMVEITF